MKILIIGGTGVISESVADEVLKSGHEVVLLNRGLRKQSLIKTINADIYNQNQVKELLHSIQFEVVIDFLCFDINAAKFRFELFNGNVKQYIFISSVVVYNMKKGIIKYTEDCEQGNEFYFYAKCKQQCESYFMEKHKKDGFPVTIIRPSHTYDSKTIPLGIHGKQGSWQNINRMMQGKKVIVHGDGTSLWSMLTSIDFARAIIGLIGKSQALGEAFQITSEEALSWNQIYGIVADELGVELNIIHISSDLLSTLGQKYDFRGQLLGNKSNSLVFDNRKLKSLNPEFNSQFSISTGIRQSIRNVMENKELQKKDKEFDAWSSQVIKYYEKMTRKFYLF